MFLSIIIPLYNEERYIQTLLEGLKRVDFPDFLEDHEIIVVDDCCTDCSADIVHDFIQQHENIRFFAHEENRGKGAAVKTGIANAKGDVYLIQDADLELNPMDIPLMLQAMHHLNIGLVNGSRYLPGAIRPLHSYKRYLANRFFTFLTSLFVNVKLTDVACGYKLIHKNLYERIELRENGFGFETEMIIKAIRVKKNNISEVPVQYFPRNEGDGKKLNNFDGIKILWTIIKYGLLRIN